MLKSEGLTIALIWTSADNLNRQGVRIGGRPVTVEDFTDFRNNLSAGSVGMDRDLAQNQQLIQGIRNRLNQATPGSQEAHDLQDLLMRAHNDSRISILMDNLFQMQMRINYFNRLTIIHFSV